MKKLILVVCFAIWGNVVLAEEVYDSQEVAKLEIPECNVVGFNLNGIEQSYCSKCSDGYKTVVEGVFVDGRVELRFKFPNGKIESFKIADLLEAGGFEEYYLESKDKVILKSKGNIGLDYKQPNTPLKVEISE